MSNQAIIFLLLGALVLILIVISAFLLKYSYQVNKKIDKLLEKGKIKDFREIILAQKEKHKELGDDLKQAFSKIKGLENTVETTIQKTGIVRFNPFNDLGGNQSFIIALLDAKNNGFVISSLFSHEGNRVYAKAIKVGKSDHTLSAEEKEVIEKAINS